MAGLTPPIHVVLAGVSARAAAESAIRAGFDVTAIDAFADLDLPAAVRIPSALSRPKAVFTPQGAARVAHSQPSGPAVYLANFENYPKAVAALAAGRTLWGNPPEVLRQARNPVRLAQALRRRSLAAPDTNPRPHEMAGRRWLLKPIASGGGHALREWTDAAPLAADRRNPWPPRGRYLQELVDGVSGSVVFVSASGRARPIGVSRQLVGDAVFGVDGYRYCGNILTGADAVFDRALADAAGELAQAVTEEFGLTGLNGLDFVASAGVPYAVELNPRWCASMELVERAYGLSVFGAHAAACASGLLPDFDLVRARQSVPAAVGKAVVFARHDVTMGDTRTWLGDANLRDVPHPGERVLAGRPVCTVFADGADVERCYAGLVDRAQHVYAMLRAWEQGRDGPLTGGVG